jgi:predicted O-methyltransferase YrrM
MPENDDAALAAEQDRIGELAHAFMESRILLSAVELGVFRAVASGADTADAIADAIAADPRATEMLLNALAAVELLEKEGGRYRLSAASASCFGPGVPAYQGLALMHAVRLWDSWSRLSDCVRLGHPPERAQMDSRDQDGTRSFIAAMHSFAEGEADAIVARIALVGVRRILDLGGGSGRFSIAFARACPGAEITVFDLPQVVPLTEGYVADAGLSGRVRTHAGDMLKDAFGGPYDLAWISSICHMFSPEQNVSVLRKVRDALAPGGRVIIRDFLLEPDRASPRGAAVFALNMLVNTERGNSYTTEEYLEWLADAGLHNARAERLLPGSTGLVTAEKAP